MGRRLFEWDKSSITVGEMIAILQQLPGDLPVYVTWEDQAICLDATDIQYDAGEDAPSVWIDADTYSAHRPQHDKRRPNEREDADAD